MKGEERVDRAASRASSSGVCELKRLAGTLPKSNGETRAHHPPRQFFSFVFLLDQITASHNAIEIHRGDSPLSPDVHKMGAKCILARLLARSSAMCLLRLASPCEAC